MAQTLSLPVWATGTPLWTREASPGPAGDSGLGAVAATSATSAWAIGDTSTGKALVECWNGTRWPR